MLRGLVNAGALEAVAVDADRPLACPDPDYAPPELNDDQQRRRRQPVRFAIGKGFDPVLLDGVTGSGKTEVYFEAIAECLRQGRQALVLLPEIALTEPFLKRFEARFGCAPVAWHSDLRSSQRRRAWRGIASGEAAVTVGARSALFLPYPKLGLIVVDEAHEPSFKQEDGVQYHARDTAVMRGKFEDIPVILSTGDAGDREPAHGRARPLSRGQPARALRRRDACPTSRAHRPDPGPAAARPLAGARRWSPSSKPTSSAASSRCCSSTAAASRR